MEYVEIINTIGFPIACVLGVSWVFFYVLKFVLNELIENRAERKQFIETLQKYDARFDMIETKVDGISYKLDKEQ